MITTEIDIPQQLSEIHYKYEIWITNKLPANEAYDYHKKLYELGNIQVYEENGQVLGYVESFKINYEQLGRIVCHETFDARIEDINGGNICYLNNCWIHPDYRNSRVVKVLTRLFFARNFSCQYFIGSALRKKTQPIKVFKKADLISKLFTEGGI